MDEGWFARPVEALARSLIGVTLLVDGVGGVIVETEAYDRADPASHSFAGATARNAAMFGPVGCAYVYRIYGLHWCFNVVGGDRPGGAVLIRAIEPAAGRTMMIARRGMTDLRSLCGGPGRLAQALGINGSMDGLPLDRPPFLLVGGGGTGAIATGPRIGISRATDRRWRFGLAGSPYLSRAFPTG